MSLFTCIGIGLTLLACAFVFTGLVFATQSDSEEE